jgi:hypothetical protein
MRKFEESLFPNDTNNALRKRGTPERSVKIASSLAYNTSTIYIRAIIGDLRIYQKFLNLGLFFGAGDRFRTDDLVLGKPRATKLQSAKPLRREGLSYFQRKLRADWVGSGSVSSYQH